jgi:hypothetical protein
MIFFVGLHHPAASRHFDSAFISVNSVRGRKRPVPCAEWIMDSGAFTELSKHGRYRHDVEDYAAEINRLAAINPGLKIVVAQDYMCEPFITAKTGMTVSEHQRLTVERYDALREFVHGVYVMPVLQGYRVDEYITHIDMYGERLKPGMLVGVGSVCKRNGNARQVDDLLTAIKRYRPDLRLHGFGLKITALGSALARDCLYSADSMAWSFAARYEGRDGNCWKEAKAFANRIETMAVQLGWAM